MTPFTDYQFAELVFLPKFLEKIGFLAQKRHNTHSVRNFHRCYVSQKSLSAWWRICVPFICYEYNLTLEEEQKKVTRNICSIPFQHIVKFVEFCDWPIFERHFEISIFYCTDFHLNHYIWIESMQQRNVNEHFFFYEIIFDEKKIFFVLLTLASFWIFVKRPLRARNARSTH